MTTEFSLQKDFEDIRKGMTACDNNRERLKIYRKHIKYELLPPLIERYKTVHPEISWGDAYLAVRDAFIEYVGEHFPREGILAEPFPGATFESKQTPILDKDGKFHCCYRRNKEGLAAFRQHTLSFNKRELIRWYHHSSPVPYEMDGDKKYSVRRLEATIANLQQLPGDKIAEIRLLSPMKGLKETFSAPFVKKYFTTLNDYDQLLETAIAAELSGKKILLFNLGVNYGRKHASSLQKKLNVRGLKTLLSRIPNSGISLTPNPFSLSIDDPNIKDSFLTQLSKQHSEEYSELPQHIDNSTATTEQKQLYKYMMELLSTENWAKEDFNFRAQALMVLLCYSLGYFTVTGCNDAKDRDGALTNVIEALIISGYIKNQTFDEILKVVQKNSLAEKVAEAIAMPGAKGLDVKENPDRDVSRIFKLLFTKKQHEKYKKRDQQEAVASAAKEFVLIPVETTKIPAAEMPEEKGFWGVLCRFGRCLKKIGSAIVKPFWSLLFTIGLVTTAVASTDAMKDGVSASTTSADSSFITQPGTIDPTPQSPLEKRRDDVVSDDASPVDEIKSEDEDDEEDGFHSGKSSASSSPTLSNKDRWLRERKDMTGLSTGLKIRWYELRRATLPRTEDQNSSAPAQTSRKLTV